MKIKKIFNCKEPQNIHYFEKLIGYKFPDPDTLNLIESHGHFHLQCNLIEEFLQYTRKHGVIYSIYVACDLKSSYEIFKFSQVFQWSEDQIDYAIGLHPNLVNDELNNSLLVEKALSKLEKMILLDFNCKNRVKFIGECGLDSFRTKTEKIKLQEYLFRKQIKLANKYNKILIIHNRNTGNRLLEILVEEEYIKNNKPFIYHCYSNEDMKHAITSVKYGGYLGIGGAFTYKKNIYLRDLVKEIPIERILLESDAPYLPPQGWRGQKNSTILLQQTNREIANQLGMTANQLAFQLFHNLNRLKNQSI